MEKIKLENVTALMQNVDFGATEDCALYIADADEPMCITVKRYIMFEDLVDIAKGAVANAYVVDDETKTLEYAPALRDFAFDAQLIQVVTNVDILNMDLNSAWYLLYQTELITLVRDMIGVAAMQQCKTAYQRELEEYQHKIDMARNSDAARVVKNGQKQNESLEQLVDLFKMFGVQEDGSNVSLKDLLDAANGVANRDDEALVTNILDYQEKKLPADKTGK